MHECCKGEIVETAPHAGLQHFLIYSIGFRPRFIHCWSGFRDHFLQKQGLERALYTGFAVNSSGSAGFRSFFLKRLKDF